MERCNKLLYHLSTIHTALLEIVAITTPPQEGWQTGELRPFLPLPFRSHNPAESSGSSTAEKRTAYSNKSTPQRSGHASVQHFSPGTTVQSVTPTHDITSPLGPVAEGVIVHFCERTFETVNKMVLRSHDLFSRMLWSRSKSAPPSSTSLGGGLGEGEGLEAGEGGSKRAIRVVSFNVPDSPEKVESQAEVGRQEAGEIQAKVESLMASLQAR